MAGPTPGSLRSATDTRDFDTPAARATHNRLEFSNALERDIVGGTGAPIHDPCVIAYLLEPALFTGRHINVEIETGSELTLGMTVADWWRVTGREANATFIRDVDAKGFFDLLTQRIGELDRRLGGATG